MSRVLLVAIILVFKSNGQPLCSTLDGQVTTDQHDTSYVASANLNALKGNYVTCQGECISACTKQLTTNNMAASCSASGRDRATLLNKVIAPIKQDINTGTCQWNGQSDKTFCGFESKVKRHPGYRSVCVRPAYNGQGFMGGQTYVSL